jgi:protein ImuA
MQSMTLPSPARAAQLLARLPRARAEGPALWLADRLATAAAVVRPTGFAALDTELPGGGWPAAGLTELLLAAPGSGELRLLAPALAHERGPAASVLWIAPPLMPYAPALQALGWPLDRLVIVAPGPLADTAWAAEQGLRSGACAAVLWWQGEGQRPSLLTTTLRRLHLAAQEGRCPLFALRPASARWQSSPAPLRLSLEPAASGQLAVTVFKRRGPAMVAPLQLTPPVAGLPVHRTLRPVPPVVRAPLGDPAAVLLSEPGDAVVRAASERIAA